MLSRARPRGLEAARRQKQQAEETQNTWSKLKARESMTLENLNRMMLDLPSDRQGVQGARRPGGSGESAVQERGRRPRAETSGRARSGSAHARTRSSPDRDHPDGLEAQGAGAGAAERPARNRFDDQGVAGRVAPAGRNDWNARTVAAEVGAERPGGPRHRRQRARPGTCASRAGDDAPGHHPVGVAAVEGPRGSASGSGDDRAALEGGAAAGPEMRRGAGRGAEAAGVAGELPEAARADRRGVSGPGKGPAEIIACWRSCWGGERLRAVPPESARRRGKWWSTPTPCWIGCRADNCI